MSRKNSDKKKQAAKQNPQVIAEFWSEKKPILIFLGGFGVLMAIFYGFWFSEIFKTNILAPVVKLNAGVASVVLNIFGYGTQSNGSEIFSKQFSINVKQGCDAIEPIAIFAFAVLLFPVSLKSKSYGLLAGIPLLWLLNQVRIISLFVFGIYSPTLFEVMHVQVWQAVFIAATLVLLGYWIVWALKIDKQTAIAA